MIPGSLPGRLSRAILVFLLGCPLVPAVIANEAVAPPVLEFALGLPGKQVKLSWQTVPGLRYRVEKSEDLGGAGGSWKRVATLDSSGVSLEWRDPEAVKTRCFYRVVQPQAEVFSIQPPVLSADGGTLSVQGQCLPPGAMLALEIEGPGVLQFPLEPLTGTTWQVHVSGSLPPGARVVSASILEASGALIAPIDQQFSITASGRAEDGPPGLPPAAPVPAGVSKPVPGIGIVVKNNGYGKRSISDDEDCDGPVEDVTSDALIRILSRTGYSAYSALAMEIQARSGLIVGNEQCDDGTPGRSDDGVKNNPMYKGGGREVSNPLHKGQHRTAPAGSGLPGEVSFHFEALSLPCPAGPPLAWVMTYRSSVPLSSAHGPQWDFSYNISIEPIPAGSRTSASRILVRDGGGRADVFHRQADGTYRCDGLHRQGSFSGDTFTLTFADQGRWVFKPLDGSPAAGKIASIIDRNNVALTCDYDAATGLLSSVSDAFSRSLGVSWDASSSTPRISSVADSSGRTVHFTAHASGEAGGTEGTLKSIACAALAGIPPEAAPFTFTYTTGQSDPNLNDNLLSITDGAGRLLEAFTYHATTDRRSAEYDRCASHDRHATGAGPVARFKFASSGASAPKGYAIYRNDELGRVTETLFDAQHRQLRMRQYTGFWTPGAEVGPEDLASPVSPKLRASDPDFFETQYSWNPDHALVQATDPDGSQLRFVHEREMKPGCPVIERGNVRTVTLRSASGETRTVSFDYQPGFGTLESAMPGGPIRGSMVKCGRNPGGDVVAQGRASSGGPVDDSDLQASGSSSLRHRNTGWNGTIKGVKVNDDSDSMMFRKILDRGEAGDNVGLLLRGIEKKDIKRGMVIIKPSHARKKDEGGRRTPFHNTYRPQFSSRGITINTSHVEYRVNDDCDDANPAFTVAKQTQGATFGEKVNPGLHAAGSVMGLVSGSAWHAGPIFTLSPSTPRIARVVTGHGQEISWTYDSHGNPLSCATPIEGGGASFQHDTLGRCTSISLADGTGSFVTEFEYDAATGMPSRVIQDPGGLALTSQFEYDPLGRCIRSVDPGGFDTLYEYLPSGRLARSESPPVGSSRIATTFHYDAACRLVRCDVENRNPDGSLHSSNSAYSTFFVYDSRARLVRIAEEERPVVVTSELTPEPLGIQNFAVCDFTINPSGEITRVSTPAACRGGTDDLVCDYQFDERGLLYRCIQGGLGSTSSIVDQLDYSSSGLPVRTARLVGGAAVSQLHCDYDGFHRLSAVTDPMGNVVQFSYDSRGGVTTEVHGELIDQPGSAGNVLLKRKKTVVSVRANFQLGALACEDYLTLPGLTDACYDLELDNTPSSACRSLFHRWETRDDTITEERFTAGSTAPPVIETTVITRSPAGLVKQVSSNGDLLATFTHDTAGRTLTCSNAACSVSVTRDTRGNVLACGATQHFRVGGLPPKTFTTTHQYDPMGRLVSSSDSSGNTVTRSHDSLGRLHTMVTALACTIRCDYDGSSTAGDYSQRVSADLDGDGAPDIVVSSLHRCGEWISSTDPQGHVTSATRDALGRISRIDHPEGTYETFAYNARGLHHQGRLLDGTTCDIVHDLNGRVVSTSLGGSPAGVAPVPPTVCAHDGLGRVVSRSQGTSVVSFAWDSLGACVGETQGDVTVSSSYNHRGRTGLFTSVQAPYQLRVAENRDSLGRVLSVSLVDATGTLLPPAASFEHLGLHVSRIVSGNGVRSSYTYRGDGDAPVADDHSFGMRPVRCVVTDSSGTVLADSSVSRDAAQLASSISTRFSDDPAGSSRLLGMTRDKLGRVTAWTTSRREGAGLPPVLENSVSHTLDSRGMRSQTTGGSYPGSYTQSPALPPGDAQRGRYTSWPQGTLEWDQNRNLTRIPYGDVTHTMQYDALGRLVSVSDAATGSPVAQFSYDALDRLVTLTVHGGGSAPQFTRFIYDGSVCIQELGADGVADLTHVVSGGIRHCISTRNGTIYYPHSSSLAYVGPCDASGVITGASGAVVEHRACDGDGRALYLTSDGIPSSTGGSATPIRWISPECRDVPNTRTCTCATGLYVSNLGMVVGKVKALGNPNAKKEYVGHVTLLK